MNILKDILEDVRIERFYADRFKEDVTLFWYLAKFKQAIADSIKFRVYQVWCKYFSHHWVRDEYNSNENDLVFYCDRCYSVWTVNKEGK